jgi:hypothetical protein
MAGNTAGTFAVDNEHSTKSSSPSARTVRPICWRPSVPTIPASSSGWTRRRGAAFLIDGYVSPEELIRVAESVQAQ